MNIKLILDIVISWTNSKVQKMFLANKKRSYLKNIMQKKSTTQREIVHPISTKNCVEPTQTSTDVRTRKDPK